MKKISLLFFIVGIAFLMPKQTQAQNEYRPMAVEGAHWVVMGFDEAYITTCITDLYEYHAYGDTVVDQITYKKIYKRDFQFPDPPYINYLSPPYIPASPYHLVYLMRDDIENRKVYAKRPDDPNLPYRYEEYLLYDFSKNIGDVISFELLGGGEAIIEDIFYHFMPEFNETVKVYACNHFGVVSSYYEGIGSAFGLFEPMHLFHKGGGYQLLNYCVEENGSWCNEIILSIENQYADRFEINLFPNPTNETVHIQLAQPQTVTSFQICNLYGSVLHAQATNAATEYTLNTSILAKGTYLVYFYNQNQIIQVKKLVVIH
jgi:hypothetical protein